jgi:hypothetical protein
MIFETTIIFNIQPLFLTVVLFKVSYFLIFLVIFSKLLSKVLGLRNTP